MKNNGSYYKILAVFLAALVCLSGCVPSGSKTIPSESIQEETVIEVNNQIVFERSPEEYEYVQKFSSLGDEELLRYIEDSVYADLDSTLDEGTYEVKEIQAIYLSKEYIEEYNFNTRPNIYFGYTLDEVENKFKGKKYVFSVGDNGETIVKEFEGYDDTYDKVIRNVAIGSGVILICVTVAVATDGLGAPAAVCAVFAASAKGAATMAISTGVISGVFSGIVEGIKTGDMEKACKAGALSGSEGFMWGAISGALIEGGKAAFLSKGATVAKEAVAAKEVGEAAAEVTTGTEAVSSNVAKLAREAEKRAFLKYGGKEQVSYLNGIEVNQFTAGGTRPDVVRTVGNHLEAIEVKYYDLERPGGVSSLIKSLSGEVSDRLVHLPKGSTQRIVIDVTGRGYSQEFVNGVVEKVSKSLWDIYPDIPIDVVGV